MPNNLEDTIEQMLLGLDLDSILTETQDAELFSLKLAPQEMDRLVNVVSAGLRSGFTKLLSRQIQNSGEQEQVLKKALIQELKNASEDMEIKDLENKFNVADFSARVFANLPRAN